MVLKFKHFPSSTEAVREVRECWEMIHHSAEVDNMDNDTRERLYDELERMEVAIKFLESKD